MTRPKAWFDEPAFAREGFVPYSHGGTTYKLWFGAAGRGERAPMLVLHGGPGGNHHNLVPFQALGDERAVIFYDQLGCGNSERPDDPSLWTAERYFDEVQAVVEGLGLERYHLVGHSWGTTLATGFARRHPQGILSVSLHSLILSFPRYLDAVAPKLKAALPADLAKAIDDVEVRGAAPTPAYEHAVTEFAKRFVVRTWPLPEPMQRLVARRNHQVHDVMIGTASELNVPGNLRDVDVTPDLKALTVPILMTTGRHDVCTPEFTQWHHALAPQAELHIIEASAHMTLMDQPAEMIRIQRQFLHEHE